MSCKYLFRQMRAAEFAQMLNQSAEAGTILPTVVVFFRREFDETSSVNSPWSPAIMLTDVFDRLKLIREGVPEHPQILLQRQIADAIQYGPSSQIAH